MSEKIIAFDFVDKTCRNITRASIASTITEGKYCWVDTEVNSETESLLSDLEINRSTINSINRTQAQSQVRVRSNFLHITLVETEIKADKLTLKPLQIILGPGYLITLTNGRSELLDKMRLTYEEDFSSTARSGGFLLFEIADHLIDGFRVALRQLSEKVDEIQQRLLKNIGDEILIQVSNLTRELLEYRNSVVSAREALDELATRRSPYIETSTQPFLDRQTIPLDRLANDAATERTVLSESINLYMGLVSRRTGKIVHRLTLVSSVFLPLNFTAAVYGMNFDNMPELSWKYGYPAFWLFTITLVVATVILLRKSSKT